MLTTRRTFLLTLPALAVVAKALPARVETGVDLASGEDLQVVFLGCVHDSFLFEVPVNTSAYWTERRVQEMERMMAYFNVPGRFLRLPPRP